MKRSNERRLSAAAGLALAAVVGLHSAVVTAQPPGPPPPARSAREAAPIDLTGQWVSIVTEDWRFRMVTPPAGDLEGYNLTPAAAAIANAWDPAKEEAAGNECKAYGAPAIMRMPGRLRISWQDDSTLKIETDAGRQTRLLHFGAGSCCGATVAARLVARRVAAARRRPGPPAHERHTQGDDDESQPRVISAKTASRTALLPS